MKKILVIEDDEKLLPFIKKGLERKPSLETLTATTIGEAERIFNENPDVSIVAFDGNLIEGYSNQKTVPLAAKIRAKFKGIMIAMSSDKETQKELMAVPCDYAVEKDKLAEFVKSLPGIA